MLKLHRLKITRFRSVKPCELIFHDGLNVLLGKNGSGKTTLLRLLADLYSSPLGQIAPGEEFDLEVEFRFPIGALVTRVKRTHFWRRVDPKLEMSEDTEATDYEIDMQISFGSFRLRAEKTANEHGFRVLRDGKQTLHGVSPLRHQNILGLFQPLLDGLDDATRKTLYEVLTTVRLPFRFDESLEALELIRKKKIGFSVTPHSNGLREVFVGLTEGARPQGYYRRFEEAVNEDPDTERVVMDEQQLEFLGRFVELTGLRSARAVTERVERRARINRSSDVSVNIFSNLHFSFTRRDGSEFPQEQLSYGQKRLLTFLYCQSAIPQVMIADELVNGLHHDWIESCVGLLRDRQSFLSSQNPLLLDHLSFESSDEIRKTFILCSAEQEEDRDVLTWRNMSPEEAEVVYRAYQTDVQHVSAILHGQGLW